VASLSVEGDELVLTMTPLEKVEGFHGSIRVPVSTVRQVRSVNDPWSELRGLRAPGTGVPRVIAVGTRRGGGIKDFVVVRGQGPGLVVDLDGAEFDRFVVTEEHAEAIATELRQQIGRT
jgi:uncharacterized protein